MLSLSAPFRVICAKANALALLLPSTFNGATGLNAFFTRSVSASAFAGAKVAQPRGEFKRTVTSDTQLGVYQQTYVLGNLADNKGAVKRKRVKGRGDGSTRGNKCGRGTKGQKARGKIGHPRVAFTGGQMPFYLTQPVQKEPTRPFAMRDREKMSLLKLSMLQQWIDAGRIDTSRPITMKELHDSGVVHRVRVGVRVVDDGCHLLRSKVHLEASQFGPMAIKAIEACGGKSVAVYFTPLTLRALIVPHKYRILPRYVHPQTRGAVDFYADDANRGYLALQVAPTYPAPTATFYRGASKPIMYNWPPVRPPQMTAKLAKLIGEAPTAESIVKQTPLSSLQDLKEPRKEASSVLDSAK